MLQLVAEFVSYLVLECLLRGTGYLICRIFLKEEYLDEDQGKVLIVGFIFWVLVIGGICAGYAYLAKPPA